MQLLRQFADLVEQVSIDEAYLDVTHRIATVLEDRVEDDELSAIQALADSIRKAVTNQEKITCSIGAGDKWIRNIFVTLSAIVFSILIGVPYWGMDITIPYEWGAVATVMFAFIILALYYQIRSTRETIPLAQRKRVGIFVITIIIIGLLLLNVGAFTYYRLNFNNNYIAYQWNPLVSKQIAVGRWAAGIQDINYTDIAHIPSGNTSETLSLIRQWDSNSSLTQSQNRIGVNWLQLVTPPQIVYVNNKEYWVSPTTFQYPDATDWIATHLIYTHSSKIIVMDTHTGEFVNATTAFGLKTQPLMYYGEDNPGVPGFANDVYFRRSL